MSGKRQKPKRYEADFLRFSECARRAGITLKQFKKFVAMGCFHVYSFATRPGERQRRIKREDWEKFLETRRIQEAV